MTSKCQVVPDTNLFFECIRLEDLPWSDIAVDNIEIVLTKPVLDEIDRHKKGNGRTKKRAHDTFKRIRPVLYGQCEELLIRETGPTVKLVLSTLLLPSERLSEALDFQKTDDHLVALVAGLVDSGRNALLLTHDAGPAATAKTLNVPFFLIPDEWLRPSEESQEAKRTRQLEQELRRYASQEPHLTVKPAIDDENGPVIQHLLPVKSPLDSAEIEAAVQRLSAAHPATTDFTTPPAAEHTVKFRGLAGPTEVKWTPPSEVEQEAYLCDHYPAWLTKCRDILAALHDHLPGPEPCYVGFEIENDGSRPASNMRVEFSIDGSAMILRERNDTANDEDNDADDGSMSSAQASSAPPKLPAPPKPPAWKKEVVVRADSVARHINKITPMQDRTAAQFGRLLRDIQGPLGVARQLESTSRLLGTARVIPEPWDIPPIPKIKPHDSEAFYFDDWSPNIPVKVGALTCDRFRHQSGPEFFWFRIIFDDGKEHTSSLLCTVHAENLTQPVRFRVRIEQVHVPTKPVDLLEQLLVDAGVSL